MERRISVPEMILWTATRIALGTGIGMLLSGKLDKDARKATGIALLAVGAVTTVPLGMLMVSRRNLPQEIRPAA